MSFTQLENLIERGLRPACVPSQYQEDLRALADRASADPSIKASSEVFGALASPTRLTMLKILGTRELCVCEISSAMRLTQPTTSHHLGILERAGLVEPRSEGKWTFYRAADRRLLRAVDSVGSLVHRPSRGARDQEGTPGRIPTAARRAPRARDTARS